MLGDRVANMTPGELLADMPVSEMIFQLGSGIAEAQLRMDQASLAVAEALSTTTMTLRDEGGVEQDYSLLELGFTPSFYEFKEAEIELRMELRIKVEETFTGGAQAQAGGAGDAEEGKDSKKKGEKRGGVWGASINAEYHHRYEFDVSASSRVTARMALKPTPQVFLDRLRTHARQDGEG